MRRLLPIALAAWLLGGCGGGAHTVTSAPLPPEPSEAPAPAAGPSSGRWMFHSQWGASATHDEELSLTFAPDGTVLVDAMPVPPSPTSPNSWTASRAQFEGLARADLINRTGGYGRDRLDLVVDSPTRMHGTLSIRVNGRWIPLPVTAERLGPAAKLPASPAVPS